MTPIRPKATDGFHAFVYRVADVVSLLGGLAVASHLGQKLSMEQFLVAGLTCSSLYAFAGSFTGNYRQWRGASMLREIAGAWMTWGLMIVAFTVLGAMINYGSGLTRFSIAVWSVASCTLLAGNRAFFRSVASWLFARGYSTRSFAVVGATELGIQLAKNISDNPQLGLRLVGFFDDRCESRTAGLPSELGHWVGKISDLIERTRNGEIQTVYITFPMRAEERIRNVLNELADSTASVYVVPDFFVFEMLHSRWSSIQGLPVVSIFENPFYGIDGMLKRSVDLVLGASLLAMCAIPMAIVAVAVKWTSPGPILFRQKGMDWTVERSRSGSFDP